MNVCSASCEDGCCRQVVRLLRYMWLLAQALEVAAIGRWVDCCVAGVYLYRLRGGCYRQVGGLLSCRCLLALAERWLL